MTARPLPRALRPAILAAALLGPGLAPAAHAQELGRLFLTPEQRAALDARRSAKVPDKNDALIAPITRIDGYVQRGGGKSTVWVNGEPLPEGAHTRGARIQPARSGAASVSIPISESAPDARARAGQSVDTATGAVHDPLGTDALRIRRPAERAGAGRK